MSREITTHRCGRGLNEKLTVSAGTPASGGAPNYRIEIALGSGIVCEAALSFAPFGHLTNEVLLAVVLDRLDCFQAGPFSCEQNEAAASCLRQALALLHARTKER